MSETNGKMSSKRVYIHERKISQWLLKTDLLATFSPGGLWNIDIQKFEACCQGKDHFLFVLPVSPVLKYLSLATNGVSASNSDVIYIQNVDLHFTNDTPISVLCL